ncbi:hypothetical protein P691DRAFT_814865 [Macrolepiota fuliginosa MF-IS2]|uniref:Uncharacterized protein n=1 Tax=Macrolepiota fuliginosa MF-IS2 TaxID=1400762 RepID=A0A9P5XEN1_9AGAR|nr:hypothetical protein P691DRAFT_814865 [Macrolepiota fuliginosa MF-IS2]
MSSEPNSMATNLPPPTDPGMHPTPELQSPPPSYRSEASSSVSTVEEVGQSQYHLWRECNPRAYLRTGSSREKILEEGYGASWSDSAGTAKLATARNIAKVIVKDKIVPAFKSFMKAVLELVVMVLLIGFGGFVIWLTPVLATQVKVAEPTATGPPHPGVIPTGYHTTTLGRWN